MRTQGRGRATQPPAKDGPQQRVRGEVGRPSPTGLREHGPADTLTLDP